MDARAWPPATGHDAGACSRCRPFVGLWGLPAWIGCLPADEGRPKPRTSLDPAAFPHVRPTGPREAPLRGALPPLDSERLTLRAWDPGRPRRRRGCLRHLSPRRGLSLARRPSGAMDRASRRPATGCCAGSRSASTPPASESGLSSRPTGARADRLGTAHAPARRRGHADRGRRDRLAPASRLLGTRLRHRGRGAAAAFTPTRASASPRSTPLPIPATTHPSP